MRNFNESVNEKELGKLVLETFNHLKNDKYLTFWKTSYGQHLVQNQFQIAYNYFRSILLISETQDKSLILPITPLARAMLEILFTTIYLFEDFEKRTLRLAKVLNRERKREIDFYEKYYSDKPEWLEYISKQRTKLPNFQGKIENEFFPTKKANIDWSKVYKFPKFTEMKDHLKAVENKNFFDWLHEIHYSQMSVVSHPEPSSIAVFSAVIHKKGGEIAEDRKNHNISLSLIILLSIISEVEIKLNFGLKPDLVIFWNSLKNSHFWAEEFYLRRYQKTLLNE